MAREGRIVTREAWKGGMLVYHVPAAEYPTQTEVAKKLFGEKVKYGEYFAQKVSDDMVVCWVPSYEDLTARDWYEVLPE